MAIARVQSWGTGNGGSAAAAATITATAGSNVTVGNGLIVISAGNGAASATTVTGVGDTFNTYAQFPGIAIALASGETLDIWYCKQVVTGGLLAVQSSFSQNTGGLSTVIEVTGQDTGTFIDAKHSANGNSTAPNSGAAGNTAQSGEFLVGVTDVNSANALSTAPTFSTALVSITTETLADNTNVAVKGALSTFDGILASIAAETFSATSGNHAWICAVAAFLPAGAVVSVDGWGHVVI